MTCDKQIMRRRQKQLISKLIAGGLVCLLLFRVDFLGLFSQKPHSWTDGEKEGACQGLHCEQNNEESIGLLRKMMEKIDPVCKIPHLKNTIEVKPDRRVTCNRQPFSRSSCRLVQELYGDLEQKARSKQCKGQQTRDHCSTEFSDGSFLVHCHLRLCGNQKEIYLGVYDTSAGKYQWKAFKEASALETAITDLTGAENPGFCIVSCKMETKFNSLDDYSVNEEYGFPVRYPQIVNLPPYIAQVNTRPSAIDFNVIFVDSTSRHHFFRALPQTHEALENVSGNSASYKFSENPVVLDFTLVQGVRSRTFETLQTFFSGYINPYEKAFGMHEMPKGTMRVETLLKPLQNLGYRTLWLEDLCPLWEWGLSKDLLAFDKDLNAAAILQNLRRALDKAGIDGIGNTLSSCLALHAYDVADPFHGPDEICFNGRPHLEYQFDYLRLFQEMMISKNKSFFSFHETNIGHEENGKRIVMLDTKLAEYLNFAKSMQNTITILMSDHGNSYGRFIQRSVEGRIELYQPFLFMILPENVQRLITETKMQALLQNQFKLVSVLDLHYMLQNIIDSLHSKHNMDSRDLSFRSSVFKFNQQFHITKEGLMGNISESRSCSIMPRLMPNMCICKDFEVRRSQYAYYYILALFTIGELNNNIQMQRRQGTKGGNHAGGFGRCVRLKLATEAIKNMQETEIVGGKKSVTMDIHISTPVQKQPEIFIASLSVAPGNGGQLSVVNYDRMSMYSSYSVCADPGVTLSLCICDLQKSSLSMIYNYTYDYNDSKKLNDSWKDIENPKLKIMAKNIIHINLKIQIKELEVMGSKCAAIVMGSNEVGVVVEGINACEVAVKVSLDVDAQDMALSRGSRVEETLYPGDVTFLLAGLAEVDTKWQWAVDINHSALPT